MTVQNTPESNAGFIGCPFCGLKPDIGQHPKGLGSALTHNCKYVGAICMDWTARDVLLRGWNQRARLSG